MQKVDLVIAGVGAVALVATVLGIVFYEDASGEETLSFQETTVEGAFASQTGAGTSASFTWGVPDNATGGEFDVEVSVSGSSVVGGTVGISVTITAPDGSSHTETGSLTVNPGSASASGSETVTISHDWFDVPEPIETDDPASVNTTKVWTEPVSIQVTITGPGNALGDTLSYGVSAGGDARVYERAPPRLPDDPATA